MADMDSSRFNEMASGIFFPRPDMPYGEEAAGAADHLFEVSSGVSLRLRHYPGERSSPLVLFFHGNGETARDYDFLADAYRALPCSLAVADYRGYGLSGGTPSFETFLRDAHATLDYVEQNLLGQGSAAPLVVMGRSLGSAPAIELAASRSDEIAALIVESGFANILPLLELIGVPAQRLGFVEQQGPENLDKMGRVSMPSLIIHARQDQIIPFAEGELLFEACRDPDKSFLRVPHAGHNDIQPRAGASYFKAIRELMVRIPGTG